MNKVILIFFGLTVTTLCMAHDTKVSHPVITLEAYELLKQYDSNTDRKNYAELFRTSRSGFDATVSYVGIEDYPLYWGVWHTSDWNPSPDKRLYETLKIADDDESGTLGFNAYSRIFEANNTNIIAGVVEEDHPFTKVLNHFYHAYSAIPLTVGVGLGNNSRVRAIEFLQEATNMYGYEAYILPDPDNPRPGDFDSDDWVNPEDIDVSIPYAKMLSFKIFGEALHHVEDMSSIAHVHNDSHLVGSDSEKDDYEGLYLPPKIFQMHDDITIANWFVGARSTTPATVINSDDIWPQASTNIDWATNSLARKVYNASIFKANLPTPGVNIFSRDVPIPSGELYDMFGNRLHWVKFSYFAWPSWRIEGVGDWHYKVGGGYDQWWDSSEFGGPDHAGNGDRYFYLEQKMGDIYNINETNLVIINNGVRNDLFSEYSIDNNLIRSNEKLLVRHAEKLIPLAIQYSAGFTQYWYDHVNSPPYLKSVKVKQKSIPARLPGKDTVDLGYDFIGYEAHWQNVASKAIARLRLNEPGNFVAARKLKRSQMTQPLYNDQDLIIILSFSEPIIAPYEDTAYNDDSGFKIGLQRITKPDNEEIREPAIMFNLTNSSGKIKDPEGVEDYMIGSTWEITVPKSELEDKFDQLEGAVRLVVFARDKNNHRTKDDNGVVRGAELDAEPQTPAKVYAELINNSDGRDDNDDVVFKWHTKSSELTTEYSNSTDENGDTLSNGAFSYDYIDENNEPAGDTNHILWFSPDVDLDKLLEKTINKKVDSISITSMPEKNEEAE